MKEIDWANLSFGYMKTDYNVRCYYRDGKWGEIEVCSEETLNIHMAATCLHYGQEAFEGFQRQLSLFARFEEVSRDRGEQGEGKLIFHRGG